MKKLILALIAALAVISLAACGGTHKVNGNALESQQQLADITALEQAQPLPHYNYSQLRQNLIELQTALARGVQGTYFDWNMGVNHPIHQCNAVGAPIPTTDQLSNPNQIAERYFGGSRQTGTSEPGIIGQMDPIGVYTGNSTGTWIMCVGANGVVHAHYWEGEVQGDLGISSMYNPTTQQTQDTGVPTFHFSAGH